MSRLRNIFLTGLLVLVPAVLTVWILQFLLGVLDGFSQPLLVLYLGRKIPGAGAVLTALIILWLGAFSNLFIGRRIFDWMETQVARIPFVRSVYSTTRQVVHGFSSNEGVSFKRAVLLRRGDGSMVLGFVTREFFLGNSEAGEPCVAVYVPTNHLYLGDVFFVPPEQVVEVDMSLEEGISTVLSCGGSLPETVDVLPERAPDEGKRIKVPS